MMMREKLDSLFSFFGAKKHRTDGYQRLTSSGPAPKPHPVLQDFESKLAEKLDVLRDTGEMRGFLSIDWHLRALWVVASTHADVQALIPDLTHEDDMWVPEYLDDSAKRLEVCNVLKRRVADVQVHPTSLQGREGRKDRSYFVRARKALLDFTFGEGSWIDTDPELESCASMLRAMGKKVVKPEASDDGFFNVAIYSAKVITIFLCFLVVGALGSWPPCVRRSLTKLDISRHFLWAPSLFSLVRRGKDEINKHLTKSGYIDHGEAIIALVVGTSLLVISVVDHFIHPYV